MACECDYDLVGDPAHYVRCNPSTLCLEHDMCCVCDEQKAILLVDGDKVCRDCALEEITVCPNCGWEAGFEEHVNSVRDRECGNYDEEWLTCRHCKAETDDAEVKRVNAERLEEIKKRLKASKEREYVAK